jgi:hemoglobin
MDEAHLWNRLGAVGVRRLVAAFYAQIPGDDLLGPMYPEDDLAGAEQRLAGFLCFRLGGEMGYINERGHPRLRMRHAPFKIGIAERDRWLLLMRRAMASCEIPPDVSTPLDAFFTDVADFLRNAPTP